MKTASQYPFLQSVGGHSCMKAGPPRFPFLHSLGAHPATILYILGGGSNG